MSERWSNKATMAARKDRVGLAGIEGGEMYTPSLEIEAAFPEDGHAFRHQCLGAVQPFMA